MHPVIFRIGNFFIYSYGTMIALAFIVCFFLLKRQAKEKGISIQIIADLCFWVLLSGIIGARILYIILNFKYFITYPEEIYKLHHGGLVLYGGIIAGTLTGILYVKKKKQDITLILDMIAPYIALSQAIGRIGCLLNGCCFGYPHKFGMYFDVHNQVLIPAQLFSSLANLLIFIVLRLFQQKIYTKGSLFILFLLFYSTKRFFIEFLRADSPKDIFGLSIFQVISLVIFLLSISILFKRGRCRNLNLL